MPQSACPRCGYVLDDLDGECRRCALAAAHPDDGPRTVFGAVPVRVSGMSHEIAVTGRGIYLYKAVSAERGRLALLYLAFVCLGALCGLVLSFALDVWLETQNLQPLSDTPGTPIGVGLGGLVAYVAANGAAGSIRRRRRKPPTMDDLDQLWTSALANLVPLADLATRVRVHTEWGNRRLTLPGAVDSPDVHISRGEYVRLTHLLRRAVGNASFTIRGD
jgi:hypothetical protein